MQAEEISDGTEEELSQTEDGLEEEPQAEEPVNEGEEAPVSEKPKDAEAE